MTPREFLIQAVPFALMLAVVWAVFELLDGARAVQVLQ